MVYTLETRKSKTHPSNISNREIYLPKHYEKGYPSSFPSALVTMLGKQQIVKSVRERRQHLVNFVATQRRIFAALD
jgi:hypothetical protein